MSFSISSRFTFHALTLFTRLFDCVCVTMTSCRVFDCYSLPALATRKHFGSAFSASFLVAAEHTVIFDSLASIDFHNSRGLYFRSDVAHA